jgi:hypothetical protein
MIDRGGPGERIGRRLLGLSDRLFAAWHQARDGELKEGAFQERILRLRPRGRRALEDGTKCSCATTAGTCAAILRVEEGLWNFVWFPGVEPTNNAAERALRLAPCGDLAPDQRGYSQRVGEPVRRADADGGGHLPATGPERPGVPDTLFPGPPGRSTGSFAHSLRGDRPGGERMLNDRTENRRKGRRRLAELMP